MNGRLAVIGKQFVAVYQGRRQIAAYQRVQGDVIDVTELDSARTAPEEALAVLAASPPPAPQAEQPPLLVDPTLRAAAERTRADLGPEGKNYPDVRRLLAFAERAIKLTDAP